MGEEVRLESEYNYGRRYPISLSPDNGRSENR